MSEAVNDHDDSFAPMVTLGSTGLKQHSGVIDEEFLARLRGRNAIKFYLEMYTNSPVLAAALGMMEMLIRGVEWRIEPADESDEAKAEAEDTEGALEDMEHTFDTLLSEILTMLWAGWAGLETTYKLRKGENTGDKTTTSKFDDGKWGWRKHEIRAQDTLDRWVFDDDGNLVGMVQITLYGHSSKRSGPIFIPIEKLLLFRTRVHKGNPEGKSLLRACVIPYWFIKRIQELEAVGIERNLDGMPIMEVPKEMLLADAPPKVKAARKQLEEFITQIKMHKRWGGLVPTSVDKDGNPTGFKFSIVSSSGRRLVDTDVVVRRHRAEMLMVFLAQFMVMGTGQEGGNRALSGDVVDLFGSALTGIMDAIASVFNRDMIPRRQRLNGVPSHLDPIMTHGEIRGPDLDKVGKYLKDVMSTGAVGPNPALERKLLEIGDMPQPPEEDAIPVPSLNEDIIDSASRTSLSVEQVRTILEVNSALKKGTLDRAAAINTLARALGLDVEEAEMFIPSEDEEEEPKVPSPPTDSVALRARERSAEAEALDEDDEVEVED